MEIRKAVVSPGKPIPSDGSSTARGILSPPDLASFKDSETRKLLLQFIKLACTHVRGKPISMIKEVAAPLAAIVELLDELDKWIDELPPIEQPMRFGNKAFRTWHERLVEVSLSGLLL